MNSSRLIGWSAFLGPAASVGLFLLFGSAGVAGLAVCLFLPALCVVLSAVVLEFGWRAFVAGLAAAAMSFVVFALYVVAVVAPSGVLN